MSSAIVERELLRGGRRWTTFAVRFAFVGLLLWVVVGSYQNALAWRDLREPGALAEIGRDLFEVYVYGQFWLVGLVTPLLAAQAVVEERGQGTLELLAMARLSPAAILRGKLVATLARVLTLAAGGLPILALTLAFGGVAPGEAASQFLVVAVGAVVAGCLGLFFGLFASNPILPTIATWATLFLMWMPGALPAVLVADRDDAFGWTSLAYCVFEGIDRGMGAVVFLPCAVWLALAALVLAVASAVFAGVVASRDGEDADAATLSLDVWGLERWRRRAVLGVVGLVLSLPALVLARWLVRTKLWTGVGAVIGFAWTVAALATAIVGLLLLVRAASAWRAQRAARRAGPGWRSLLRQEEAADAAGAAPEALPGRSMAPGPAIRVRRPRALPWQREVWRNPVAWREVVTRAHGLLLTVVGRVYIVAFAALALFAMDPGRLDDAPRPQAALVGVIGGYLGACLLAVLAATASMTGEQRRGTLALLATTPLGGAGVVRGKLFGVLVLAGPLFAVSSLAMLVMMPAFTPPLRFAGYNAAPPDLPDAPLLLYRWAVHVGLAGVAIVVLTAGSFALAARAGTAARAWFATLGWAGLLAVGPPLLLGVLPRREPVRALVAHLNPVLDERFWEQLDVPDVTFLSMAVWSLLALALLGWTSRRLGEWAR